MVVKNGFYCEKVEGDEFMVIYIRLLLMLKEWYRYEFFENFRVVEVIWI